MFLDRLKSLEQEFKKSAQDIRKIADENDKRANIVRDIIDEFETVQNYYKFFNRNSELKEVLDTAFKLELNKSFKVTKIDEEADADISKYQYKPNFNSDMIASVKSKNKKTAETNNLFVSVIDTNFDQAYNKSLESIAVNLKEAVDKMDIANMGDDNSANTEESSENETNE